MEQTYNRAKPWQLLFFVFNNTASNIYLSLMGFVNLYAGNVAGMAVILVSNIRYPHPGLGVQPGGDEVLPLGSG